MPLVDLADLDTLLSRDQTLAGLDLGTKTIGIAVCDLGFSFATPRPVLRRTKFTADANALVKALEAGRCGGIVVGLPINMDGTEGPRAQATRAFVRNYLRLDDRPIALWDERLSTVAAERGLLEVDMSRTKRADRIDSAAAAFILQGALDRLATLRRQRAGE